MSGSARVDSIDAIKEFRICLTKFREMANDALGDADSDLNRIQTWLEVEQTTLWSGQLRKRQEILSKAEEALRYKLIYKDSTGSRPSAVDEQKAVNIAKRNVAEAEQKIKNIKGWIRRIQKEVSLYRGGVSAFAGNVSGMIPTAIGQLGATIEMLEKYIGLGPAPVSGTTEGALSSGSGGRVGGPSMARADGQEIPAEDESINPDALRKQKPTEKEISSASNLGGAVKLACGSIADKDHEPLKELMLGEPAAGEAESIVIARPALAAKRICLVHEAGESSKAAWRIDVVDDEPPNGYNIAKLSDLLAGRADFAELTKMPAGWIAVLGQSGLVAIFNQRNEKVFPQPAAEGDKK